MPDTDDADGGLPILGGAVSGGGAAVAVVIALFVLIEADDGLGNRLVDVLNQVGIAEVTLFDLVLWTMLDAQFVDIRWTAEVQIETIAIVSEGATTYPELVYTLVPVLALVLAGYVLVETGEGKRDTDALKGALVVVGYLPAMVGLRSMATVAADGGQMTVEPALLQTVLFAGLLFPVVCGIVGGYLAVLRP